MGVLDNIFWNIMKIVKIYIALFFYPSVSKAKLSMVRLCPASKKNVTKFN